MRGVETVTEDGIDYAIVVRRDATSEERYNFLTRPENTLQVGVNFYSSGESIRNHYHRDIDVPRCRIQEFILIGAGSARLNLFDNQQQPFRSVLLKAGDMVMLLQGGHGFDVVEDTKIVEVKQGPYQEEGDKVLF